MKKLFSILLVCLVCTFTQLFAETYKVQIKGEVYIKTVDGDMYQLELDEDNPDKLYDVDEEDTIIVGDGSKVTFTVGNKKIIIRTAGAYKVSTIVK